MDGKNTLNLRLDKQWLCLGRFRIVDHSDVVLVKIRLGGQWKQRLKVEDVIGYLKSLGIL
jgi:RNA binding exosome subunit